ncbi:MAG: CU044_2847 family protein [Pleurocapsa sp. MO_192.B19]|nr:CU044_2847 family protein [Pleurocapsa sp. MO_192.B19]
MESQTLIIPVELSDGTVVKVEATPIGEQRVAVQTRQFKEAMTTIKSIAQEVAGTVQDIKQHVAPSKMSVELGIKIGIESGNLTALIVKGTGEANLKITMEWG